LISAQPQSRTARDGSSVTFGVTAEGNGPVRHQWLFNGAAIAGATTASLTLTNVQLEHAGDYAAILADDIASVLSESERMTATAKPTRRNTWPGRIRTMRRAA